MSTTIVIADDHPVVLKGLASLITIETGLAVIGLAEDGITALKVIQETRPQVALIDLHMPRMGGREVLDVVIKEHLPTRVVLIAAMASDAELYDVIAAGAAGVVLKDAGLETLLKCIKMVSRGLQWLPDNVVQPVLSREARRRETWREVTAELTGREREILGLVVDGANTKQISFKCKITPGTTKVHMNNIFRKMHISSKLELQRLYPGY